MVCIVKQILSSSNALNERYQSAEDGADASDDEHFQHEELLLVVLLGRGLAFPTCSFVQTKKVL